MNLLSTLIKTSCIAILLGVSIQAHALTVAPARIEISGNPGQTLQGEIDLYNEQNESKIFYTSYENFESNDDSGAPKFIGGKDGLATWVGTDSSVSLNPQEKKTVPFSITIPAGTEPGGYFSAVFFGSQPVSENVGEVSIGGKIGVLLLLKVNGDVREGAGLADYGTDGEKKVYSTLPVKLFYKINNTGADRIVPEGKITILNTFRMNSADIVLNEGRGSILPNSSRKFEAVWVDDVRDPKEVKNFFSQALWQIKDFHLGWYTAKLNVVVGATGSTPITKDFHFFVIPWQLLTLLLIFFVGFGIVGKFILHKYNKWIINQATHPQV